MKVISVHITGFYHSSFHAYTTEVNVDGHRWRLGLRYSKFHEFYEQLVDKKKDFHAEFPPKGTLFFTPKPEERQEQLEVFMQHVLEYFAAKGHSTEVEDLLCDLLKVPRHLRSPEHEDDDVSTSTESVLDEPPISDSVAEVAQKETQVDETKQVPVQEAEPEPSVAKEEKASAPEPEQSANPEVEEPRPVEEAETPIAHEKEVEKPTPVEEPETAKETVEEDIATVVEKEAVQDEVEPIVPEVSVDQRAEEIKVEEAPMKEAVAEVVADKVAESAEPNPEEPDVASPKDQPLVEPFAVEPALPQAAESSTVSKSTSPTQHVEQKEITINGRVSSWITAIFPKSLLGFIRRRCMKKTNLVVLCVALLLPMVLARR